MKFQTKINIVKKIDNLKSKINNFLHKKPFYKYLYKRIQYEFMYNNKSCIRYYLDANTLRDESFKVELQLYHKVYGIVYDECCLADNFIFTKNYIENRLCKYSNLHLTFHKDEYGLYFEIGYIDGY